MSNAVQLLFTDNAMPAYTIFQKELQGAYSLTNNLVYTANLACITVSTPHM